MKKLSASTFIVKRLADNINLGPINAGRMKPYYEKQQENPIEVETTTDESKKTEQAPRTTSEKTQEMPMLTTGSPNFGRKEKCRNVIMSKTNKVENKNGTSVEMLDAFKRQHMIVRNFNALTLSRTFSPSLLFLFSTFSFFGIFMFRHFHFRPKLGLPNNRQKVKPDTQSTGTV